MARQGYFLLTPSQIIETFSLPRRTQILDARQEPGGTGNIEILIQAQQLDDVPAGQPIPQYAPTVKIVPGFTKVG